MNTNLDVNNKVFLQGEVNSVPELNHKVKDEEFYSFNLKVDRLSGQSDFIPIIIPKFYLDYKPLKIGNKISVKGQFRSYNKLEDGKTKLLLSVYAKEIGDWIENVNSNVIELDGFICKPVIYRGTPFGREISDVLLAVNRNYNKSDYIPCIAWGTNAQIAKTLQVPTRIKIIGRIQSRPYNKKENDVSIVKIAYEVSISKLIEPNLEN